MSNAPAPWKRNDPLAALDALNRRQNGRVTGVREIYGICTDGVFETLSRRGYVVETRIAGRDGIMDVSAQITQRGREAIKEIGVGVQNKATRAWFASKESENASLRRRTRIEAAAKKVKAYRCPYCGRMWAGLTARGTRRQACGYKACSGRHGGLSRARRGRGGK